MLSPDSFVRSHKRHVTDVIRVALERRGILGFIEIHERMTLLEARTLIWENVEHAPCDFQFVLDDGVPVSARQESTQQILHFYPCVKIRECAKKPAIASPSSPHPSPFQSDSSGNSVGLEGDEELLDASSAANYHTNYNMSTSNATTEKISVYTASGDAFDVWISEHYTFQQLRRDAARYWNLPANQAALVDGDGCLWPEQAKVLSVMSVEELLQRKIILESKAGASASALYSSVKLASSSSTLIETTRRRLSVQARSPIASPRYWDERLTPTAQSPQVVDNPVEELWRVFTFYCVHGDSLELESLKAHQFNKLLKDARVLASTSTTTTTGVTPAVAHIIYTSETKGKPQSSGKMNYDEFLNALVKIALARQRKTSSRHLQSSADTQEEDELFQRLVQENILPLASRWPTALWDVQTQLLRTSEIVGFVAKFLDPLLDIYLFYAKSHLLNPATGVKQFYLSYADYQRFVNDFAIADLQISSVEAAQVFLAACSSGPFHDAFHASEACASVSPRRSQVAQRRESNATAEAPEQLRLPGTSRTTPDPNCDGFSITSSSVVAASSVAAAFHRLAACTDCVVQFSFPAAQVGRICMSFSAFLDALGRLGLTSFAKTTPTVRALPSTKAVFHHLSRGLTRSRVLDIVHNHGSSSMHSGRFYSGSVAFTNKFLDMWRYEGSPDYLTGGTGSGSSELTGGKSQLASGETIAMVASSTTPATITATPLSPSRRLTSSAALFDERVVVNGAGRGREALDRLVRDAFIRNATSASAFVPSNECPRSKAEATTAEASKVDAVAPSSPTEILAESNGSTTASRVILSPASTPAGAVTQQLVGGSNGKEPHAALSYSHSDSDTTCSTDAVGDPRPPIEPTHQSTITVQLRTPQPLQLSDQKTLYESILLKGGVFKKYGQWGHPHRRFVWCSPVFDGVYWRPINKKHSLSKDGISVASVLAVLPGNSTRTRYAFMKHLSDEKSLNRCLSLVAEDRRLDLEADSEATRDLWVQALLFLTKQRRF